MNKYLKFDLYGRDLFVEKTETGWRALYEGGDGKKYTAENIFIPSFILEEDLEIYIDDLCHEMATPDKPNVRRIS